MHAGEDGDENVCDQAPATAAPRWLVIGGLTATVAVLPLTVALVALRNPRWYPLLDLAQTELQVRDVGTRHTPLVGLQGRFEAMGENGNHLGPLSFYALWPLYALLGGTAWALQAAAAALNVAACGTATWIGHRRGGQVMALAVAAVLAVLMRNYGPAKLTEPWNPYMPMLWWVVFLLAIWSVLCDDLPMLPVAVFAGSFCIQTHIPYLGLVGGVAAMALAVMTIRLVRHEVSREQRGRVLRWGGASAVLLVALWIPPLVEQVTTRPGNLSIVRESLTDPGKAPGPTVGEAVRVWLGYLNPFGLLGPSADESAVEVGVQEPVLPGAILLVLWLGAAGLSWWALLRRWQDERWRDRRPALLHAVVGAALLLGFVSVLRIQGAVWVYLMLWAWATTIIAIGAIGWTATQLATSSGRGRASPAGPRLAVAGLVAVVLLAAGALTSDAASTEVRFARRSALVARLAPQTIDAVRDGSLPGSGTDGRYLVLWSSDRLGLGGQGYGLFLEMERQGLTAGTPSRHAPGIGDHRVLAPGEATAAVHYVVGSKAIDQWRATPDAVLVAEADLRTAEEIERFDELHDQVQAQLAAAGSYDLIEMLDMNLFLTALLITEDEALPTALSKQVNELYRLGLPAAVFVTPPDVLRPEG